jgi:hypothetical protein
MAWQDWGMTEELQVGKGAMPPSSSLNRKLLEGIHELPSRN